MDGVIVDNHFEQRAAWQKVMQDAGLGALDEEKFEFFAGRQNHEIFGILSKGKMSPEDVEKFSAEKEKHYHELADKSMQIIEGLEEFLRDLKFAQIPVALATSAPRENVDFVFNRYNLWDYFKVILDASDVAKSKPDPEIYLKAAEKLGFAPKDCFVFEDSISGIRSAKAAGCRVGTPLTTLSEDEALAEGPEIVFSDFYDKRLKTLLNVNKI